ncbi:UDP-N-acetylmuramoyl-tripeptide--D-alanyl-D-alanine ligase [Arthrobacter roseus]|uniref:UDP-N-acetylmuramoyl-tripeptide--D-alanyl-D- alanine ligase n=1 Tax=Arthrobacter roseus TaxID=136274 RepID=UPI00196542B1|nr:UDP-N-acetylmuramoyl-tripeptide--D-alanyl-D-alanine ligase [Arthrobacter roseus]MBM7848330.1 UDP-N-acetylmuramoyl-tripeptide--D-alanyl-D-alanine ligase [Arthrobacter roseus]
MIELTAADIADITDGELRVPERSKDSLTVTSATTDSRECEQGGLFVARAGEHSDGHLHLKSAFANGAVLALTERVITLADEELYPCVVVKDSVLAMGALAAEIVRRLRAAGELTVIGVTGSAGKTTTKDLLKGLLETQGTTIAPRGSYNGEVGVPLTVFTAGYGTRFLVIEMGATGVGHIKYLADMVRPDIGVVLCVGSAHAGEFGGVENIAAAKGELLESLAPDGVAIINADDQLVLSMESRTSATRIYFTSSDGFIRSGCEQLTALNLHTNDDGHPFFDLAFPDGSSHEVQSRLIGLHHATNLLAAAAAAFAAGMAPEGIATGLSSLGAASRWRMERVERADGVTVINDAYNANPESMKAALRTLAELARGRRSWAVLGEMLELGDSSIEEHDAIGRVVVRLNISRLIVVGRAAKAMHNAAVLEGSWGNEAAFVETAEEAERILTAELAPEDIVLFKSSNATGLRHLGDRIALRSDALPGAGTEHEGSGHL